MTALFQSSAGAAEICRGVTQMGLSLLIQSTLLLVVGLAVGRRLASRGPSLQALVYRTTLVAVVLTALLSVLLAGALRPFWSLTLPPTYLPAAQPAASHIVPPAAVRALRESPVVSPAPTPTREVRSHQRFGPVSRIDQHRVGGAARFYLGAVVLWGGGSALLLSWLLFSHLWVGRLRRGSVPIRDGVASVTMNSVCRAMQIRPPMLLASRRVQSPFLIGVWRPAILLPSSHESEFDAPALQAIMIHELTHLARRDCAWRLLARLVCALIWPQPLLWLLSRRLAQVGEEICDQAVLQEEINPHAYADCLLRLAERLVSPWPERAAGLGVVPFRSALGRRIEQILDGSRRRTLVVPFPLRAAVALGAAAAVVGGLALVSAAAPRASGGSKARQPMGNAEKPAGGPVSGRVVTPDGKPVAGASVSWVSRSDEGQALLGSVQTDAEGQFRFTDTTPLRHKDDFPQLVVEAPGWGLTFRNIPEEHEAAEISLVPATELRVSYMDPSGQPVPKLKISPLMLVGDRYSAFMFPPALAQRSMRLTDAEGSLTLPGLPQGFALQLKVEDDRFAHLGYRGRIQLSHSPVTHPEPVRLQPGASLRGRVLMGATGKPVAGIKVGAQGMGPEEGWGSAVSDANGEYRITQLPPGAYNVALDLKVTVAQSWTARAHEGVGVHSGKHLEGIDFELIPGAIIKGRVIAADTGEPLPGLAVGVYGPAHPQSGAWVQRAVAAPDGAYLQRVPGGKQHLYFQDIPPNGFLKPLQDSYDLTVKDGEVVTADFKLPRGARVRPARGRVMGPDGKPVAKAEIVLSSSEPGRETSLTTDADGAFAVSEQFLAQTVTLRARRGDLATAAGTILTSGQEVTLRLQRDVLVSLSGRVTEAAGRPIAGASISLIAWTYDRGSGSVVAQTDREGRYRLADLWPDLRYSVDATAKGFGRKYTEQVQLRPGESRELAPLVLQVADRSVAGRVVDEQSEPVAGAQVNLNGRESAPEMKATDGEGKFRFDAVVDEKLGLQAYRAGYQWARKETHAGKSDVILVLTREATAKAANDGTGLQEQYQRLRGRPAPALHAAAWVNSAPRSLTQLRGKVVLIDFWGIGCGPCVASLPGVQRAAEQFAGKGLVVVGLHNAGVSRSELQAFARKHRLTYPLAIDAADDQGPSFGKTFREYTVQGIPSVAVIDRNGRVAYLGHSLDEAIGTLGPMLAQTHGGNLEQAG